MTDLSAYEMERLPKEVLDELLSLGPQGAEKAAIALAARLGAIEPWWRDPNIENSHYEQVVRALPDRVLGSDAAAANGMRERLKHVFGTVVGRRDATVIRLLGTELDLREIWDGALTRAKAAEQESRLKKQADFQAEADAYPVAAYGHVLGRQVTKETRRPRLVVDRPEEITSAYSPQPTDEWFEAITDRRSVETREHNLQTVATALAAMETAHRASHNHRELPSPETLTRTFAEDLIRRWKDEVERVDGEGFAQQLIEGETPPPDGERYWKILTNTLKPGTALQRDPMDDIMTYFFPNVADRSSVRRRLAELRAVPVFLALRRTMAEDDALSNARVDTRPNFDPDQEGPAFIVTLTLSGYDDSELTRLEHEVNSEPAIKAASETLHVCILPP